MTGSPIFSVNFTTRKNPTKLRKLSHYVEIMNQPFMGFLYHVLVGRESKLMFETIFMIFSLVENSTYFPLLMHHFVFNHKTGWFDQDLDI